MDNMKFKKRPGTTGIRGQLYETKLLSLLNFRAQHDNDIEEFFLATNVDGIGEFDDICLRAKVKGFNKPIAVFIQAKHSDNNKLVKYTSKKKMANYFNSYLKIKRTFQLSNENVLFEGKFCETECLFVFYTIENDHGNNKPYEGSSATYLNNLVRTGNTGTQASYTNEDVEILRQMVLVEQLVLLAQKMAKYITMFDDVKGYMMMDELVLRYHVILAQQVFNISEIQPEGHRIASFRQHLLTSSRNFIALFIYQLCSNILEKSKVDVNETKGLLKHFLSKFEDSEYLSKLIGNELRLNIQGKFEFHDETVSKSYREKLDYLNGNKRLVMHAVKLALKRKSIPLEFKVPATFGNKDLAVRGNDMKIEKRLDHITWKLSDLIEKTKGNNIITIDESMEDSFLRLNGGIASAVGNILVYDDTSKLLKFCDSCESLGNIAKKFFAKLQSKIPNFQNYKFDIRAKMFPKLSLDSSEYEERIVKDFFSKFVYYANQADENRVGEILKNEIQYNETLVHNLEIRSEAIFLKYHEEVQKWWMKPKEGSYLTKKSELYKNAVDSTTQPLMGVINMMHKIKYKDYSFNENSFNSLKLQDQPSGVVIVTENSTLTVAKLLQFMKNKDFVVLDLKYILNATARDYNELHLELKNANNAKGLIVVVDKVQNTTLISKRLENIACAIKHTFYITVAVQSSVEIVKKYFSLTNDVIKDERNNLTDLSIESQKSILEDTNVIFQGEEISLGELLDDESVANVGGDVLHKLMHRETNILGKWFVGSNYVNVFAPSLIPAFIQPIETKVTDIGSVQRIVSNFKFNYFDIKQKNFLSEIIGEVIVIIGNPGMGKSTYLSHVAIEMKRVDPKVWILRINLLEYARQFGEWQEDKTVINTLESLKFMCQAALSEDRSRVNKVNITLEETNGVVFLKDYTGDEWTEFELKMFLHYYNTGKLIFLFDGFDEICPDYAYEVLTLIKVVENYPSKPKIWVTSRSYHKIITVLEVQFGILYEIVPWNYFYCSLYIYKIWDNIQILKDLNDGQLNNIYKFIMFMAKTYKKEISKKNYLKIQAISEIPFSTIYFWFMKYLKKKLPSAPSDVMGSLMKMCKECDVSRRSQFKDEFVTTPLHLNLMAGYLYNKVRETNESPDKWCIDTNIFNVYGSFLETKLKRIRFQDKNQIDMYKPDNILAYKKEYSDFVAKHKKLAAYIVFHKQYHDRLFDTQELKELNCVLDMVMEGVEKTGIVCNVVNGIPRFVHHTFAEYFAVEFICDLIKSCKAKSITKKENRKSVWDFILNVMFFNCNLNFLSTLDAKVEIDTELTLLIVEENQEVIFELLMEQSKRPEIKSSLCEAIRNNLRNLGKLLLSIIENNLSENNLITFIKIVKETNMLMIAIKMEFEEIIDTIIELVKRIDKSKLNLLFANYTLNENIDEARTDELIHALHKHVWTRMDIVPDWKNLAELSGQIYFI